MPLSCGGQSYGGQVLSVLLLHCQQYDRHWCYQPAPSSTFGYGYHFTHSSPLAGTAIQCSCVPHILYMEYTIHNAIVLSSWIFIMQLDSVSCIYEWTNAVTVGDLIMKVNIFLPFSFPISYSNPFFSLLFPSLLPLSSPLPSPLPSSLLFFPPLPSVPLPSPPFSPFSSPPFSLLFSLS